MFATSLPQHHLQMLFFTFPIQVNSTFWPLLWCFYKNRTISVNDAENYSRNLFRTSFRCKKIVFTKIRKTLARIKIFVDVETISRICPFFAFSERIGLSSKVTLISHSLSLTLSPFKSYPCPRNEIVDDLKNTMPSLFSTWWQQLKLLRQLQQWQQQQLKW